MGAVYEARHESLGKRVAIKTLLPEMAEKPEIAARFMREGQAAARIRHPHVVDVYDVGSADGFTWLVMELLDGSDLEALLESKERLGVAETIALLLPVISALDAAHREGVFHRDLKPANIFLSRDSIGRVHPKVVDFGISKIVEEGAGFELTRSAAVLGTPYYMAPEQVHSIKRTDARSDQYSLGVILYECLTGQRPFSGESLFELMTAITTRDATRPDAIVDAIPAGVCDVIVRAMRREPSERFASVRELGQALYSFADGLTRALWASEFGAPSSSARNTPEDSRAATLETAGKASTLESLESEVRARPGAAAGSRTRRTPVVLAIAVAAFGVLGALTFVLLPRRAPQPLVADSSSSTFAAAEPQSAPTTSSPPVASSAPMAAVEPSASSPIASATPADTAAVPGVKPATTKPAPQVRSTETSKSSSEPPPRPGSTAVRGANSAWIIR